MGILEEPFGDALRRLREAAGLTQEQLAEQAGLSLNAISSLERGERQRPYPNTLQALAAALDLHPKQQAYLEGLIPPRARRYEPPVASSAMIGRTAELQIVVDKVMADDTRLLTLIGPGGVGKTRLALAAAEMLATRLRDGVAVVSLAALRDSSLVLPGIVRALDLREWGSPLTIEALAGYLRRRNVLLVLDNFEHVLDAAPEVAEVLAAAPRLRILVTSRSPLAIQGEQLFAVPPLSESAAIELFLQRSAALAGASRETVLSGVPEICARLDCLPLALELAAAQTRVLSPTALLAQLEIGTQILTSRARDAPDRHRSLRQTIAWSYDLLTAAEEQLFRRLAVCAGGWTLDAAAAIGGVAQPLAIDQHRGLVDASLIVRRPDEAESRFGMLETIRVFAAEQLHAHGEAQLARHRHSMHYTEFALAAGSQLWGPDQARALDRLELEHDNIRAAVGWLLVNEKFEDVARIAFADWLFWWIRGFHREGGEWVEAALSARAALSDATQAKLLYTSGSMILPQGRYDLAASRIDEAARIARSIDDASTLAWALVQRGYTALTQADADAAASAFHDAEAVSSQAGEWHARALAHIGQAQVALARGQHAEVDQRLVAADRETRALDMRWLLAIVLNTRARLALSVEDAATVTDVMLEALDILAQLRDSWAIRYPLAYLGTAAAMQSRPERAAVLYGVADAISDRSGNVSNFPVPQRVSDRYRAEAATQLGNELFQELVERGRVLPFEEAIAFAMDG